MLQLEAASISVLVLSHGVFLPKILKRSFVFVLWQIVRMTALHWEGVW